MITFDQNVNNESAPMYHFDGGHSDAQDYNAYFSNNSKIFNEDNDENVAKLLLAGLAPNFASELGDNNITNITITMEVGKLPTTSSSHPNASDDQCSAYVSFNYQMIPLIASAVLLLVGLVYSFFGYRLFKLVLFVSGWVPASVLLYLLCDKERLLASNWSNAAVAGAVGSLIGAVCVLVPHAGLFVTGLLGGIPIGLTGAALWAAGVWANAACFVGAGLLVALTTLKFQRVMLTLNTASLGGAAIAVSADYLTHRWQVVHLLLNGLQAQTISWHGMCWFNWASFVLWPLIGILGFFVQYRITAAGFSHKTGWPYNFRHSLSKQSNRPLNSGVVRRRGCADEAESSSCGRRHQQEFSSLGSRKSRQDTGGLEGRRSAKSAIISKFDGGGDGSRSILASRSANDPSSESKMSFRRLYQARRRHGDVICQSYMESLQKLADRQNLSTTKSETNTPTIISDRTQLTLLSTGSNSNSGSV